ncbi:uncharacterized protein LOC112056886 [Bicyclus anynana]|uniref:Uncharacterized protein LOC112056886 n=1 Tax=Bicyclus anynana TaxID=110368 RepID=A0A6J1P5T0_BICAN|nr:uncharacterized protein LOC112056886 [Bicyclus anynana]
MGRFTALVLIALLASAYSLPAPQMCCVLPPPCPPEDQPADPGDADARPTPNGDGPIKVLVQKTTTQDQLRSANFQVYPVPGGIFYVHQNPDVIIQPPPILVKPPLLKPIQPSPINIQPPQLPPITPPPICVRPAPLPPITPPPICVRPKPLAPICPPPIVVKPPTPQPVVPAPISIRQPDLPVIRLPPILVRPPTPPNLQLPTICFRTSLLNKNGGQDSGDVGGLSGMPYN